MKRLIKIILSITYDSTELAVGDKVIINDENDEKDFGIIERIEETYVPSSFNLFIRWPNVDYAILTPLNYFKLYMQKQQNAQ
jgi:hypothetical protein